MPIPRRATSTAREALRCIGGIGLTVEQYARMVETGIVPEDASVELVSGVLVRKDRSEPGGDPMGHSPLHKLVVSLLSALGGRINDPRGHLQIQLPVECPPDSAPEPDASIVRSTLRDDVDRLPAAADVTCVVEVAHSSLERDREDKLPLYAAGGIGQYVIVNLQNETLENYLDPDSQEDQYRTKRTVGRSETLELILPQRRLVIPAAELLP